MSALIPTPGGQAKLPARLVEALLIGGPRDGTRLQVAEQIDVVHVTCDMNEMYHRVPFGLSDGVQRGEFVLYLHSSIKMDVFDVVQRLFTGYRNPSMEEI